MEQLLSRRTVTAIDAVMFDIDDTLLNTKTDEPIIPIIRLARYVVRLGYKVILITARPSESRDYTIRQMLRLGVTYYELFFTPAENKTRLKEQLPYHFVLSVGDLDTDLGGSDYSLKVEH